MRVAMRTMALFALAAALVSAPLLMGGAPAAPDRKAEAALRELERRSGGSLEVRWHAGTNTPAELKGALTRPSAHTPEWIAYEFLESVKPLYGLSRPRAQLQVTDVIRSSGGAAEVRLRRMLYGLPVWGDGLTVRIDARGVVREVRGRMRPHLERETFRLRKHAKVTEREALAAALDAAAKRGLVYDAVVVESCYLPTEPGTPLVYAVRFRRESAGAETAVVFVHALTGRLIEN